MTTQVVSYPVISTQAKTAFKREMFCPSVMAPSLTWLYHLYALLIKFRSVYSFSSVLLVFCFGFLTGDGNEFYSDLIIWICLIDDRIKMKK